MQFDKFAQGGCNQWANVTEPESFIFGQVIRDPKNNNVTSVGAFELIVQLWNGEAFARAQTQRQCSQYSNCISDIATAQATVHLNGSQIITLIK